jgi:Subtilase family
MKKNSPLLKRKSSRISRTGILLSLILFLQFIALNSIAQNYQEKLIKRSQYVYDSSDHVERWLNWNILFNERSNDADNSRYIDELKAEIDRYISAYNISTGRNFKVDYHVVHCPCDPLLTNLSATAAVGASGYTSPPKPPGTGGSGDLVSQNMPIDWDPIPEGKYSYNVVENKVKLTIGSVDPLKLLAVMDTGLDPDLFGPDFIKLLWKDPGPNPTYRNFQWYHNHKPFEYMLDDQVHVHGTAVTAIALLEFEKIAGPAKPKPRIMVLKVLDELGQGSTFSVSCALSYTVQKQATLVNASLGYYSNGQADSILLHYVHLLNDTKPIPIPLVAAAGNIQGTHNASQLCVVRKNGNELTKVNTFDPASFSKSIPNVITVTTLQNEKIPCFYQNYSNEYVDVGVANGNGASCCKFTVPFESFGYEGSSFATPFISGKFMACLMAGGTVTSCRGQWTTSSGTVTKGGKFVPNP